MRGCRWILTLIALLVAAALHAGEAGGFSVLKVVRGDAVAFVAVSAEKVAAEKLRLLKEANEERAAWQKKRDAFAAKRENSGKSFHEPEPEPAEVTTRRSGFATEAEASAWAKEQEEKARCWAVLKVIGTDGQVRSEVCEQAGLRQREADVRASYDQACAKYDAERKARALAGRELITLSNLPPMRPRVMRVRERIPTKEAAEKFCSELPQ